MNNTTVVCFGDSNTWGYEPISGGRYPAKERWVDILAAETGCTTVNVGLNGRQIPHTEAEIKEVTDILDDVSNGKYTKNIKTGLTYQDEFVIHVYQNLLQKEKVRELHKK